MRESVYTPGAGHAPPVLAGRDNLLRDWQLMLNDTAARGRVRARDTILVGPRGVGKTSALTAFADLARQQGTEVVSLQAVLGEAGLIDSLLQRARALTAAEAGPWRRARDVFEHLAGFSVGVAGFSASVSTRDTSPLSSPSGPSGRPDGSSLAGALAALAGEVGQDTPGAGVLITVDEMQVAAPSDLALLAATLHRLNVDHPAANVTFAATGLPFTPAVLRTAGVTHPDRLFIIEDIPLTLTREDARYAIVEPARAAHVTWDPEAVERLIQLTNGYPAHLQLFADAAWSGAPGPGQIVLADVEASLPEVGTYLERRTLGPRWERITDRQLEFMAALALHGGQAAMADIARTLGRPRDDLGWLREELIKEGDTYAPRQGQIAMAVPLFNAYVLTRYEDARTDRTMPLLTLEQMRTNAGVPPAGSPERAHRPSPLGRSQQETTRSSRPQDDPGTRPTP